MTATSGSTWTAYLLLTAVARAAALVTSAREGACAGGEIVAVLQENTTDRLSELRRLMSARGASAYIVPTEDSHLRTAFTVPADRRRQFISGYKGTIGTAIILNTEALLWTDYGNWVKAKKELDSNWKAIYPGGAELSSPALWIVQQAALLEKRTVMANQELFSAETWLNYAHLLERYDIALVDDGRVLDTLWESMPQPLRRPAYINRDLHIADVRYSGRTWQDKVADVLQAMNGHADLLVLSHLEDISWLFNLYGSDVENRNNFFAFAIVPAQGSPRLYIREHIRRLKSIYDHLRCDSNGRCSSGGSECAEVHPYHSVYDDLRLLSSRATNVSLSMKANYKLRAQIPSNVNVIELSIVQHLRRQKNPTELEGLKNSYFRDSAAYIELAAMLESDLQGGRFWSELKVLHQMNATRSKYELYQGLGFPAIVASGSHSAEANHMPRCVANTSVDTDGLLLLDTGARYFDGMTHVARTFHFGKPSASQKATYSGALRRIVNQAMSRETAVRSPAGAVLNSDRKSATLKGGVFYFEEVEDSQYGDFGVKLSIAMLTVRVDSQNGTFPLSGIRGSNFDDVRTSLDHVLLIPFEPKLIDGSSLKPSQVKWINEYHKLCLEKVGRFLLSRNLTLAHRWLEARTGALNVTSDASSTRSLFAGLFYSTFFVILLK